MTLVREIHGKDIRARVHDSGSFKVTLPAALSQLVICDGTNNEEARAIKRRRAARRRTHIFTGLGNRYSARADLLCPDARNTSADVYCDSPGWPRAANEVLDRRFVIK